MTDRLRCGPLGGAGAWDRVRAGSETCALLLPSAARVRSLRQQAHPPSMLTLVTPLAAAGRFGDVLDSALAALDSGWGEVVVNDWGVLAELGRRGRRDLTAGRLLLRLRRGPGSSDPWLELDEEARRYFAWGPLFDTPLLEHLVHLGVTRVEADLPRHWHPMPSPTSLRISLHVEDRLVSVVGACPWLFSRGPSAWRGEGACERPCAVQGPALLHAAPLGAPLLLAGCGILEPASLGALGVAEGDLPPWVDRLVLRDGSCGTLPAKENR